MAIIGSIIKSLLEVRKNVISEANVPEAQEEVLKKLLEKAKNTTFGKYYGFAEIIASGDIQRSFAEKVPYFNYEKINENWWSRIHTGEKDVTWPGSPPYFALSSGTTGKTSKRIPVTEDMLDAIRQTAIRQIDALANFNLPSKFFEKEIMMLGSSTRLLEKEDHKEGEISGISASNIPFWFRGYYRPGEEIAQITDWESRIQRIAEKAKEWDIGALSGIPPWIELMLKKVIEYHHVNNIHDIWPNLAVFASGGVAFPPYEKGFNELLAHPITIIDTYLASEGFIAYQERPETHAMKLAADNGIYFEFVPFEEKYVQPDGGISEDAPAIPISEIETGKDYVLIISTVAGLWRYSIGDTIKFTDKERYEMEITGRTKHFLNVVGSQLSVNKMNDAIQYLEQLFDIEIPEFTVAAIQINNEYYNKWYLGNEENVDEKKLAEALDETLKKANKNYHVARSKALKGVIVKSIPPSLFYEWLEKKKKKGGQVKIERVMKEEKFKEWENFIAEKLNEAE